MQPLK